MIPAPLRHPAVPRYLWTSVGYSQGPGSTVQLPGQTVQKQFTTAFFSKITLSGGAKEVSSVEICHSELWSPSRQPAVQRGRRRLRHLSGSVQGPCGSAVSGEEGEGLDEWSSAGLQRPL